MQKFRRTKTFSLNKIVGILLVFSMIGFSPGALELFSLQAQTANPFAEQTIKPAQQVTTDVRENIEDETVVKDAELETEELEEVKKREMSRAEELAWSIGKALLPTIAVMGFAAAVVCPLAWVVVGAVAVGATAAAAMTLGYELRKNSFRDENEKKAMDKIWRDVSIAAAVNGAMAPFSMATAGIAQAIGPVTMKTIVKTAAKAGAVSFLGSTVSNVTKGAVTNLWYDHYYNYDERENILKSRIEELAKLENRNSDQESELVECLKELDTISKEKYTWERFRKDEKKALVTAGISGLLGGAASKLGAQSDWAKIVSSKLFGSTAKSAMVSNAVISNPFAFASGAALASVDKKEILNQIKFNRMLQEKYEEGSSAWFYYEQKIADLQKSYDSTDLLQAGKSAMINNAATQVAIVGTSLAKTRIFDLPSAKKKAVQQRYEEQSEDYAEVKRIRDEIENRRINKPALGDFETKAEFRQAFKEYAIQLKELRADYKRAQVVAADSQKTPENQALLKDIKEQVARDFAYARQTELAKALGTESYLQFKLKEMRSDSQYADMSPEELKSVAELKIREEFAAAAKANEEHLAYLEKKIKRTDLELEGNVERGPDGKRYVVIRDAEGNYVRKRPYEGGKGAYWFDRLSNKSPAELKQAEIERMVKQAYDSASMVKPSRIRNEYVNMRVNQLRSQGLTDNQIDDYMPSIVENANNRLTANYGSWMNITKAEILASGLEKAKYDDGASPSASKIIKFLQSQLSARTVKVFQGELKRTVQTVVPEVAQVAGNGIGNLLDEDKEAIDNAAQRRINDYYNRTR